MGAKSRSQNIQSNISGNSGNTVDWDALNKHVIETAQLEQPETLVGVISGIYDLGCQEQEDGYSPLTSDEDKEEILKKFPQTYFKVIDGKECKCYPRKPAWKVAFAVDFPDIIVDKAQFFTGESDPKPLRLILGGEFTLRGGTKIVSRPLSLSHTKESGKWSLSANNTVYKMAKAAKLVGDDKVFTNERIEELVGKSFQFSAQVFENKEGYYTEYCKFIGALGRGQASLDLDSSLIHSVWFDDENPEDSLKQLRVSVRNSIMRATDYADSAIRPQLEALYPKMKEDFLALDNSQAEEDSDSDDQPPLESADTTDTEDSTDDGIPFDTEEDTDNPFEEDNG